MNINAKNYFYWLFSGSIDFRYYFWGHIDLSPKSEDNLAGYVGEIAALATACCWTMTSIFFTRAGQLVGSPVVNRTRLLMAVAIVTIMHWITQGKPFPIDAEGFRWGWLALSGFIGYILGDALLFQAFVMIGARLSMLIMALVPVFSVLFGWTLLGEELALVELIGIALVVGGVAWVITDRPSTEGTVTPLHERGTKYYLLGLLCSLGGAVGQAAGLIASKKGLTDDFPPLSGNLIRLIAATTLIWGFTIFHGQAVNNFRKLQEHPIALRSITVGAIFGPFLGVTLSLLAVQKTAVGIASALMALTPIILLPISYYYFHEKMGLRTIFGTILAVAGTGVIFLYE